MYVDGNPACANAVVFFISILSPKICSSVKHADAIVLRAFISLIYTRVASVLNHVYTGSLDSIKKPKRYLSLGVKMNKKCRKNSQRVQVLRSGPKVRSPTHELL